MEIKIFDRYEITKDGKVINKITRKQKSTFIGNGGYERVSLWIDGKQYKESIHRLVAQVFIPNPDNKPQVNHIDGNKLNNNVSNLEWCTREENMQHAYKNNLIKLTTTKVNQYDKQGNFIKQWNSIKEASETLNINHANISVVCKNETSRKYAGGYKWKYVKEVI